ncbi:hypothetical protein PAXINDRAFT_22268 [Paxillus involutus ATCC 200175]|uniref:Uncharacterized protein n=1 Tax=Paxillus involutus ATCC 200175 TaxID=664439 RepID=A0A0C9T850_PAXIN|nr:hypothetical protein PAXINDRAFT_22268 [Paxillus involutus ATCC 200175]
MPPRLILHGPTTTTAPASKRQRTQSIATNLVPVATNLVNSVEDSLSACLEPPSGILATQLSPPIVQLTAVTHFSQTATITNALATPPTDPMQLALHNLDMEAHAIRDRISAEERADKETKRSYERHVQNYVAWWENEQSRLACEDPARPLIPAFPITPAKVVLFLDYETTREKKKRGNQEGTVTGSTVGKSQIAQAISALEDRRRNEQHKYKHVADTQQRLRDDTRIRAIESAVRHNEPKRVDSAQTLKATGTSQGASTCGSQDIVALADGPYDMGGTP